MQADGIVFWVIKCQDLTLSIGQSGLCLCAEQLLLVLLLWTVGTREEDVQGPAGLAGAVGQAAVPEMRVHQQHGASLSGDQFLVGMVRLTLSPK